MSAPYDFAAADALIEAIEVNERETEGEPFDFAASDVRIAAIKAELRKVNARVAFLAAEAEAARAALAETRQASRCGMEKLRIMYARASNRKRAARKAMEKDKVSFKFNSPDAVAKRIARLDLQPGDHA